MHLELYLRQLEAHDPCQPTLRIIGKGEVSGGGAQPRTQQAIDAAVGQRHDVPLLRNGWERRVQPHNAAATFRRLARTAGITHRITPHVLRRSYITSGPLQGVPLPEMQCAARHVKANTPSATTSPTGRFTGTRPSPSWEQQPAKCSRYRKVHHAEVVEIEPVCAVISTT